jgi:hypothetical protein
MRETAFHSEWMPMLSRSLLSWSFGLCFSLITIPALAQAPGAPAPVPAAATPPPPKPKAKPRLKPKAKPAPVASPGEAAPEASNEASSGSVTRISMNGITAKASAYYRLELRHDDHGLESTEGYDATPTTTIKAPDFKLGLDGELNHRLGYSILIDTVNDDTLEVGKVIWAFNPLLTFILGVDYVNQGGFENKLEGYNTIYLSPYCDHLLPLPGSAPAFAVQAKVAGTVTMQLVEDEPTPDSQDPPMQPAMTLEWLGSFGDLAPLAQLGVYGNGNSKYVAFGASYATKTLQATFDYVMDFHAVRYGAGADTKRLETVYNNIVVEGWYMGLAAAEPFVKVVAFAAAEPDDKDLGLEDVSYNSGVDAEGRPVLGDNANVISFGARFPVESDDLVPYAAMDLVTASFQDPTDPTATEDRGEIVMQLGVAGAL